MYAIGCDVGSQSLKGVLLDPAGSIVAQSASAYPIDYPQPGWAQQDARAWQRALGEVVRHLVASAAIAPAEVGMLGLASQVDGLVAVDMDGAPLGPAIIWLDRRATVEAAALRRRLSGIDARSVTGLNVDASHVAPKILWLRTHEPRVAERASGLLLPGSALVAWLTGEQVVDHANASSTLLYDLHARAWSARLLEAADVDPAKLGRIADAHHVAGHLRPVAADALGLTTRTRVVVGTGDEHGATLGAGGIRAGIVVDITGTAEPVCVASTRPTIDPTGLVETHGHADPRVWLVENPGFVSGGSVRWLLETMGGIDHATLEREAAAVPPGAGGVTFLPTLSGATAPRWNDRALGTVGGLGLNHGRGHLGRALLEGCAFALRDIVDRLDDLGLGADEIRVVGGGARSDLWMQVKSDVTGRTVRALTRDEATATGAAMLAGVAEGTFADLDQAVDALATLSPRRWEPDPLARDAYERAHAAYRALFDAVEPLWAADSLEAGAVVAPAGAAS